MAVSVLILDSCDHSAAANISRKWTGAAGSAAGLLTGADTAFGEGAAYQTVNQAWSPIITSTTGAWILACRFRPKTYGSAIAVIQSGGTTKFELRYSTSGTLQLRRGTTVVSEGTERLRHGVWTYIEWATFLNSITGTSEVRLNGGQVDISFGRGDTTNAAGETADRAGFNAISGANDYDDLSVRQGASYTSSDFWGDTHVKGYFPSAAGNYSNWTPLAGSNFQNVDETPNDDDTTYNSTSATVRDSYHVTNLDTGHTILAVQGTSMERQESAGADQTKRFVRISSTDFDGTARNLSTLYLTPVQQWELSPATGVAWTESEFNGAEFGLLKFS